MDTYIRTIQEREALSDRSTNEAFDKIRTRLVDLGGRPIREPASESKKVGLTGSYKTRSAAYEFDTGYLELKSEIHIADHISSDPLKIQQKHQKSLGSVIARVLGMPADMPIGEDVRIALHEGGFTRQR